jgi:hypothetical protein
MVQRRAVIPRHLNRHGARAGSTPAPVSKFNTFSVMNKEKKDQLITVIEAYQEVLLKKARNHEAIDWRDVDSMLAFLAREIKHSSVRIKLDKVN